MFSSFSFVSCLQCWFDFCLSSSVSNTAARFFTYVQFAGKHSSLFPFLWLWKREFILWSISSQNLRLCQAGRGPLVAFELGQLRALATVSLGSLVSHCPVRQWTFNPVWIHEAYSCIIAIKLRLETCCSDAWPSATKLDWSHDLSDFPDVLHITTTLKTVPLWLRASKNLECLLVLCPQGRCTRENCKYLHPPPHLKTQLEINGRNNLIQQKAAAAMLAQQMQFMLPGAQLQPIVSHSC